MKASLDERCRWMRERSLALALQRPRGPRPRRLRPYYRRGHGAWRDQSARRTCTCGTCRKCKHRETVAALRDRGYLTRMERLNAPLERCPVWQRLKDPA